MHWRHTGVNVFLGVLAALIPALSPEAMAAVEGHPPNIVFVLLDDVRYDDLVDHPFVDLPNIQRLADEGVSFSNFFTSAPLCSPSRAVFLTGQYAFRNGITDNGERAAESHQLLTFPRLLQEAGYHTGFFGKWHMGHDDDSARPGFDRWVSFVGQGVYFDPAMNVDGEAAQGEGYMTDILTDHAVSFIESSPADQPFLAYVSHKAVHPETFPNYVRSFPAALQDVDLYADVTIPRGPSWRAPTAGKPALARPSDFADPRSPVGGLPDEAILGRLRMLSSVDRGLGRLFAALEQKGVLDETLLLVTSDQGFFYGEFGLAQERRLAYEVSIRIPLLMRYPPLVPAGERRQALASNVDIAPTILDLAGLGSPEKLDGFSLLPVLARRDARARDALLIEYYSDTVFPRLRNMGYKAIRTDRYKYIRYADLSGVDEIYDLQADPHELNNLLPDRVPPTLLSQLGEALDALLAEED